jgi:hypothetical protein
VPGYNPKSVFFLLDVAALVSLVPDWLDIFDLNLFDAQNLSIARAGRAARAGAR